MLDETIPLTVNEYDEWGDPNDPEFYEYMKSYSPYDNVHRAIYPAVLVTAGLNDPRVPYWERHSGPSGRYDSWREEAFVSAFVVDHLEVS